MKNVQKNFRTGRIEGKVNVLKCDIVAQSCKCIRLIDHDTALPHACDCGGKWFGEMAHANPFTDNPASDNFKIVSMPVMAGWITLEQINESEKTHEV